MIKVYVMESCPDCIEVNCVIAIIRTYLDIDKPQA